MNILILHDDLPPDARADELDVFAQMQAIGPALVELGHRWAPWGVSLDLAALRKRLLEARPDAVVNLVESLDRQMRLAHLVPALLDAMRMPYTGVPTEGLYLTCGKLTAKRWLAAHGLDTPAWVEAPATQRAVPAEPARTGRHAGSDLASATPADGSRRSAGGERSPPPFTPGRYIIKSVWEHASLGLTDASIVEASSLQAVHAEITARAGQLGGEAFAEAFIEGREFNLALLDRGAESLAGRVKDARLAAACAQVLPPAEIEFVDYAPGKPRIVGYAAKWAEASFEYNRTPQRFTFPPQDAPLIARLEELALRCWEIFRLRGYARVDFRVDGDGRPWILEVNANPCLSADAGFMAAAAQGGLSYVHVVDRLLAAAVG